VPQTSYLQFGKVGKGRKGGNSLRGKRRNKIKGISKLDKLLWLHEEGNRKQLERRNESKGNFTRSQRGLSTTPAQMLKVQSSHWPKDSRTKIVVKEWYICGTSVSAASHAAPPDEESSMRHPEPSIGGKS